MATYTTSFPGGGGQYRLDLTVTESSTNKLANTSVVTYSIVIRKVSGSGYNSGYVTNWNFNIGGNTKSGTIASYNFTQYTTLTVASGTYTITHDWNGAKSISCSATVNATGSGGLGQTTSSGTLALTTFSRAATITSVTTPRVLGNENSWVWAHNASSAWVTLRTSTTGGVSIYQRTNYQTGGTTKIAESDAEKCAVWNAVGGSGTLRYQVITHTAQNLGGNHIGTNSKDGTFSTAAITQALDKTSTEVGGSFAVTITGPTLSADCVYVTELLDGSTVLATSSSTSKTRTISTNTTTIINNLLGKITDSSNSGSYTLRTQLRNKNNTAIVSTSSTVTLTAKNATGTLSVTTNFTAVTASITTANRYNAAGVLERRVNSESWEQIATSFAEGASFTKDYNVNNSGTHTIQYRFKQSGANRWYYTNTVSWIYKQPIKTVTPATQTVDAGNPHSFTYTSTDSSGSIAIKNSQGTTVLTHSLSANQTNKVTSATITQAMIDALPAPTNSMASNIIDGTGFAPWTDFSLRTERAPAIAATSSTYARNWVKNATQTLTDQTTLGSSQLPVLTSAELLPILKENAGKHMLLTLNYAVTGMTARVSAGTRIGLEFSITNRAGAMSYYGVWFAPTSGFPITGSNTISKEYAMPAYEDIVSCSGFNLYIQANGTSISLTKPQMKFFTNRPSAIAEHVAYVTAWEDMTAAQKPAVRLYAKNTVNSSNSVAAYAAFNIGTITGDFLRRMTIRNYGFDSVTINTLGGTNGDSTVYSDQVLHEYIVFNRPSGTGNFQLRYLTRNTLDIVVADPKLYIGGTPAYLFTAHLTSTITGDTLDGGQIGSIYVTEGEQIFAYNNGWKRAEVYQYSRQRLATTTAAAITLQDSRLDERSMGHLVPGRLKYGLLMEGYPPLDQSLNIVQQLTLPDSSGQHFIFNSFINALTPLPVMYGDTIVSCLIVSFDASTGEYYIVDAMENIAYNSFMEYLTLPYYEPEKTFFLLEVKSPLGELEAFSDGRVEVYHSFDYNKTMISDVDFNNTMLTNIPVIMSQPLVANSYSQTYDPIMINTFTPVIAGIGEVFIEIELYNFTANSYVTNNAFGPSNKQLLNQDVDLTVRIKGLGNKTLSSSLLAGQKILLSGIIDIGADGVIYIEMSANGISNLGKVVVLGVGRTSIYSAGALTPIRATISHRQGNAWVEAIG